MSVTIECLEVSLIGDQKKSYGFRAYDDYAANSNLSFDTLEEFLEQFPTEQSLVDSLPQLQGFDGSDFHLVGVEVEDDVSPLSIPVVVLGYPQ